MLQFRIQGTPNPLARKYVLNRTLKNEGKISYKDINACKHIPLASELLSNLGITQVHFFENVLTITQNGQFDWSSIDESVQNIVTSNMDSHDPNFEDYIEESKTKPPLSPELQKIDDILEKTIRPGLQMDGGDVELLDLEQNILTIRYMGACGGCPSSMTGTLEAIRHIIREQYSEDIEIVAV